MVDDFTLVTTCQDIADEIVLQLGVPLDRPGRRALRDIVIGKICAMIGQSWPTTDLEPPCTTDGEP